MVPRSCGAVGVDVRESRRVMMEPKDDISKQNKPKFSTETRSSSTNGKGAAGNKEKQHQRQKHQRQQLSRMYQKRALQFLDKVDNGRIQSNLVPQRVEELLIHCVSDHDDNVPLDGPMALDLLNVSLQHANLPKERLIPRLFSLACQVMARSHHPRAYHEVHRQLWRLLNNQNQYFSDPKELIYYSHHVNDACSQFIHYQVMDANRKKEKVDYRTSKQITNLIDHLHQINDDSSIPYVMDAVIEDAIIMFLCNQQRPQEAYDRLCRKIDTSSQSDPVPFIPPVSCFTNLIYGFAKTLQPDKALDVIQYMLENHNEGNKQDIIPLPNETCFNGLIHAYALCGGNDAGFKAEETLSWMERLHLTEDTTSYNSVLNAYAHSNHPDAPNHAERILQTIIDLNASGHDVRPTEETWCTVMNTWVNSEKSEAIARVTTILDRMESLVLEGGTNTELSAVPYTIYVKAWEKEAKKPRGYQKVKCADNILRTVERMQLKGVPLSPIILNSVLTALRETSPLNAVFYFLGLEQQYRDGKMQIATRTFNIGLDSIAALNRPDCEEKALNVLDRMQQYSEMDENVLPSRYTYNIILKVLSRSQKADAANKADALLHKMDAMQSIDPDAFSYATCVIAWGRSEQEDKFERVTNLLDRFIDTLKRREWIHKSEISVFNACLSVCHHNESPELQAAAHETALIVMTKLRQVKGVKPDQQTYSSFFRVFKGTLSSTILGCIHEEFDHCISDGYVQREILENVSVIAPATFAKFVGKDHNAVSFPIPRSWSKNSKW
jgi:hypothetical protein